MKKAAMYAIVIGACVAAILWNRDRVRRPPEPDAPRAEMLASANSGSETRLAETAANMNYALKLDEILAGNDLSKRPAEFAAAFREWLDRDLESALAYLRAMPRGNDYTAGVRMVLDRLGHNDPERAVALASELVTRHEEMHLFNRLFGQLVTDDPSKALRLLDYVGDGEAKTSALRAVASVWSRTDAESALNWAASLSSELERQMTIESVLTTTAPDNPESALASAKQFLSGGALKNVVETAGGAWLEKDPEAALESLKDLPPAALSPQIITAIAGRLATRAPEGAVPWLNSLGEPDGAKAARMMIVNEWSTSDPQRARDFVAGLPASSEQTDIAVFLAGRLAESNPEEAVEWVKTFTSMDAQIAARAAIASAAARQDARSAYDWVKSWPPDAPGRDEAMKAAESYLGLQGG